MLPQNPQNFRECGEIASIWSVGAIMLPQNPKNCLKCGEIATIWERTSDCALSKPDPRNCRDCGWRDCVDLGASERFCSLNPPPTCLECGEIATIWEHLSDFAHQILPVTKIKCVTSTNKWKERRKKKKGGGENPKKVEGRESICVDLGASERCVIK